MPNGALLRQVHGIPMGDPISPGMTIGTLAWMENEWMQQLHPNDKQYFKGARYMDDVLVVYAEHSRWDSQRFCNDFAESTCYHPPLKLVEGTDNTFLEARFKIENNKFKHWLKNENEEYTKVWGYQHFHSHGPYLQKRALLTTCQKKVHKMASSPELLEFSGLAKVRSFLTSNIRDMSSKRLVAIWRHLRGNEHGSMFGILSKKQAYLSFIAQRSKGR